MNTKTEIVSEIFKEISFSKEEVDVIYNKFERIDLKKGELLLKSNTYVVHQYYILNGCLRSYFIDKQGKEHTTQFAIKDWWITDYISYFNLEKSVLNVECIKDAVVFKIYKDDLEELFIRYPKIHFFIRKKIERGYASSYRRILDNLSKNAKERYESFIKKYPNIHEIVKNYHIASYLGITTESLSRIRKDTN